jgi:hypothetical protein
VLGCNKNELHIVRHAITENMLNEIRVEPSKTTLYKGIWILKFLVNTADLCSRIVTVDFKFVSFQGQSKL